MPLIGYEPDEIRKEVFRRLGVGPFILGLLKGKVKEMETAKKLLEETPPWDVKRRRYLMHLIKEGERARKYLEEYLRKMKELEEELLRERHHVEGRSMGGKIIEVKSSNELIDLVSSTPLLLVDVYTTWCIPCRWMASALERLADELSEKGFKIAKANAGEVDVERITDELRLEPIRGVPTLLVFKDGKEVGRIVGAHPKPEFPQELKRRILEAVENSEND